MADDTLRIVAKVDDQFTGPLGKLKKELGAVGDEAKKQGSNWKKDWTGVREDMGKFHGVLKGFEPILSKIGMGGFGAALSFGGVAIALKNFSGSTRDLNLMAKQIGLTANELRTLSELGGKVGVSADTMKGAINQFAGNMVDLRQRWGQAYGELRNMNLGKLAEELVNAPNMEAAIERAMEGLKGISDPQKRARVSTLLFGTPDIGVVASSLNGPIREAVKRLQAELGTLDKATLEAAERFEANLNRMHNRWEKLKLKTLGPLLEGADKALDQVEKERAAAPSRLRQDEVRRQIDVLDESIAHKQANGDEAGAAETKKKRDALAAEMQRLTDEIRKLREGGGASLSPTSFGGAGASGGGSLIQKAAWGGGGGSDSMSGMRNRYPTPDYGAGSGPLGRGGTGGGTDGSAPASPGASLGGGRPTGSDAGNLTALIDKEAKAAGIDPSWMNGIRAGESGHRHNNGNPCRAYDHNPGTPSHPEDSWGPFQLNRRRGTGVEFEKATGLDLSDPRTIPDQVRFVARYLRKKFDKNPNYSPFPNWQGFHGRRNADPRWGDSGYVPTSPVAAAPAGAAPADENGNFPNGAPRALKPKSMATDASVPGQVVGEPRKAVGDALMDRFYGKGATGGGPSMQMPGSGVGGAGRGTLHIKVDGPAGTQVKHELGDLFDDTTVSKGRSQMGMDRA